MVSAATPVRVRLRRMVSLRSGHPANLFHPCAMRVHCGALKYAATLVLRSSKVRDG